MTAGIGFFIVIVAFKISGLSELVMSSPTTPPASSSSEQIIPFYQWNIRLASFRGDQTKDWFVLERS
jgi:hypothetical protein